MYNLIIFGSNGMLGNTIKCYFSNNKNYNVICIDRNLYDVMINTWDHLEYIIRTSISLKHKNIVFNAIGSIPQNKNILNDGYIKVNSIFPHVLSLLCKKHDIKLIHPTTDCVYKGDISRILCYNEKSLKDEQSIYGVTKSLGEPENACVIRTSIIGEEVHNKRSLLEWVKTHKNTSLNGFTNHYWNGITTLQYAKIVKDIIEHDLWWTGVRHICSPDDISKYDLIKIINDVYNLGNTIIPIEHLTMCNRKLSTNRVIFFVPSLTIQIQELKDFFINNTFE